MNKCINRMAIKSEWPPHFSFRHSLHINGNEFLPKLFFRLGWWCFWRRFGGAQTPYMCTCVYGRAYICTETHECHALNYPVWPSTYRRVGQVDSFVLLSPSGDDMSNARPNTSRTYSVSLLVLPRIDRFSMSFRSFRHIQHISTCVSTSVCVCVCHKYLLFCELLNIYTKQIIICVCHFNF